MECLEGNNYANCLQTANEILERRPAQVQELSAVIPDTPDAKDAALPPDLVRREENVASFFAGLLNTACLICPTRDAVNQMDRI